MLLKHLYFPLSWFFVPDVVNVFENIHGYLLYVEK
jgi:hypothetical protein